MWEELMFNCNILPVPPECSPAPPAPCQSPWRGNRGISVKHNREPRLCHYIQQQIPEELQAISNGERKRQAVTQGLIMTRECMLNGWWGEVVHSARQMQKSYSLFLGVVDQALMWLWVRFATRHIVVLFFSFFLLWAAKRLWQTIRKACIS